MAKNFLSSWNVPMPNGAKVCVAGFLDNTGFYKTTPWTMRTWHCGGTGNDKLIGFEICEPKNYQDKEYFRQVRDSAIAICTYLCIQYNLKADSITTHCEGYQRYGSKYASNHSDIHHWWKMYQNYTISDFREDVAKNIELRKKGMEFKSGKEALDFLASKGRVNDKDYWEKVLATTRNIEFLLIKWAEDYSKSLALYPENLE